MRMQIDLDLSIFGTFAPFENVEPALHHRQIYMLLLWDHNWGTRPELPGLSRSASFNGTFTFALCITDFPTSGYRSNRGVNQYERKTMLNDNRFVTFPQFLLKIILTFLMSRPLPVRWIHNVLQRGQRPTTRRQGYGCVSDFACIVIIWDLIINFKLRFSNKELSECETLCRDDNGSLGFQCR